MTLPNNIMRSLRQFGDISSLRVNKSKPPVLNINLPPKLLNRRKDQWQDDSLSHLGVSLSSSISQLYSLNYPPLFKHLEMELTKWSLFDLSRLGSLHAVKIKILPKILYFSPDLLCFQSRLINIYGVFYAPRTRGRLGNPNLWLYYQGAQLTQLLVVV